jgi:hypothetical protein
MITIEGNTQYIATCEFKPKIEKCLKLLETKAGTYHGWMGQMGVKIRAFSKTGAAITENTVDIARGTFVASETWLASVLLHETIHIWQYRAKKKYYGQEAEQEANKYQLCVLRLIGASQHEITYQLSQTGNHFDLNGDGVYDEKDYQLRNY